MTKGHASTPAKGTNRKNTHAEGQGPFAINSGRIKRRYIIPSAGTTTPEMAAGRA